MDTVDVVVVGAGVVGLAVARALALAGRSVVLLEREVAIGSGVSSRNSEVIHAGLYYPSGSLKARLCVRGKELLYAYCTERGIGHRRCGKLVVAGNAAEAGKLGQIAAQGRANGVDDLVELDGREARLREPALACEAALWSPSSGIVASHELMLALLGDAENAGALLALASPFEAAEPRAGGWCVHTGGTEPFELGCRWLVNAAALGAQQVAQATLEFPSAAIPPQHLAKGHYFSMTGRAPFRHLIYPTPVDGGLGVHLTLDLGGQAKFGPDVEWLPAGSDPFALDYQVDARRQAAFEAGVRRWWPGLPTGALAPAYSGVRPKISGPGAPAADFRIDGPAEHGVAGVVMLFGIESPGLTAALAIGEHVAQQVAASGG